MAMDTQRLAAVRIRGLVDDASDSGVFLEERCLLTELAGNLSFAIDRLDQVEMLEHLANCDALTGLPNGASFLKQVTGSLRAASSAGHMLAVLDLDRFKNINDSLGHAAGDGILKQVAHWLTREVGDSTRLARIYPGH
jgi:GGDEF domain-containing protein